MLSARYGISNDTPASVIDTPRSDPRFRIAQLNRNDAVAAPATSPIQFLSTVTPAHEPSSPMPRLGKYMLITSDSGIRNSIDRRRTVRSALNGLASVNTI